ncbi:MAG: hypothetical protein H7832_06545 [Magnetococcus sp. DMHC-6]
MVNEKKSTLNFQKDEYLLSDPILLQEMRLAREIKIPGSEAILVPKYAPITKKLLQQLHKIGIARIFAEPIYEKSLVASVEHVETMFHAIDQIIGFCLDDLVGIVHYRHDQKELERLVRNNLNDIQDLFTSDPTEKLLPLIHYHSPTARHSIITGFHMMALGKELGWSDSKIIRAAIAVFNHDIGKSRIKLETLDWPGRLDNKKWKEIQFHTLFGGLLLYRRGKRPDLSMLAALLHHEWFVNIEGKGYGGLTLFADYLQKTLHLDIRKIVADLNPNDLEILQATSLVDMVSALEERRSYKRELDAFKVLIIMNSDAQLGHFNPRHYVAWHTIYQRQNPNLLPLGRRMALPREKEQRLFRPLSPQIVEPIPLLTFYEMEKLGFMTALKNSGIDIERIRRRGGLSLKVVEQIRLEKGLNFDCTPEALEKAGITLRKDRIIPEEEFIELEAWREWLTWEDLERLELTYQLTVLQFDVRLIRQEGGIRPSRLIKRGIRISNQKLKRLAIDPLKKWTVRLPASENRLTPEDLSKLEVNEEQLKQAGCLERVTKVKSGVPMEWLEERGLSFSAAQLAKCAIDPIRKIFYDLLVTEEIHSTRAKFMILREGDDPKALELANQHHELEPIQELLFNRVGEVVMDFTDLVAIPDLSHLKMGDHWGKTSC